MTFGILGDLDYLAKALLLPRSTLASGPCPLCRCTGSGHLSWCNFQPNAGWRAACWSTPAWRAWPSRSPSPLFDLEYFSPWLISLDYMHCKYLGHDMLVYGSILSLLCNHMLPGDCHANLQVVWSDIKACYKGWGTPCQFRYLNKVSMFQRKAPQYPKLRGKAAEIKYLCRPLHYVWKKYYNCNLEVHRKIELYLRLNVEVEEMLITYREELSLPLLEAKQFEDAFTAMLLLLTSIAEHFLVDRLFNITQKAHFLRHCSILSRFLNPRLTWCFQGEDMQKRMSGLAKACVNGQRPGQTIAKMISRYRLALHLEFSKDA